MRRVIHRVIVACLILLISASAFAQSYTLSPPPFLLAQTNSGAIINNACVWTYAAGTTTAQTTYSDTSGTPNTNPIRSDSAGRFTAYLLAGTNYKFVYETACVPPAHGTVLRTQDNIAAVPASAGVTDIPATAGETISAGLCAYLSDGSGGKTVGLWYKCDQTNTYSSTLPDVGLATATITSGTAGTVRVAGSVTGLSSLSVGTDYFVGVSGAITSTAPANRRRLGRTDTATSIVLQDQTLSIIAPVILGGTGLTTGTSGGVPAFTGATTVTSSGALTANGVVLGGGAGAVPTSTAALTTGQLLVGVTSGPPVASAAGAAGASMVLLKSNSGTDTSAGTTNVDTIAMASGLTTKDVLYVVVTAKSSTQATASLFLVNSTDTVTITQLVQAGTTIIANETDFSTAWIQDSQTSATSVVGFANSRGTTAGSTQNITVAAFTTAYTGAWTLALQHGGVTAGGTLQWRWSVYKLVGQ